MEAIGEKQRKITEKRRRRKAQKFDKPSETAGATAKSKPLAYALARSWAWSALTFRCSTHPEEISDICLDERGESILHWTCLGKPPIETVQAILDVCPKMARVRNMCGHLPLHVAIGYRASVEVIRSLLEVFPESAGLPNGVGAYPLHLLCDYGSSVDSLRAVLETPAGAATVAKRMGKNTTVLGMLNARMNKPQFRRALVSMREARKRQQSIRDEMQQRHDRQQQQKDSHQNQQHHQQHGDSVSNNENIDNGNISDTEKTRGRGSPTCDSQANAILQRHEMMIASFQQNDYWQKAAMLILVEYTQQPLPLEGLHDDQANIVHACAGASSSHAHLLEFALLLHEDDLLGKRDAKGRSPLHVAALNHATSLHGTNDSTSQSISQRIILQVLEACPKAAFVKDDNDQLPLALALQELRQSTTPKPYGRSSREKAWSPGLQRLLDENLAALETLNLDERLYPMILKRMTSPNELFLVIRRHPNLFQNRQ